MAIATERTGILLKNLGAHAQCPVHKDPTYIKGESFEYLGGLSVDSQKLICTGQRTPGNNLHQSCQACDIRDIEFPQYRNAIYNQYINSPKEPIDLTCISDQQIRQKALQIRSAFQLLSQHTEAWETASDSVLSLTIIIKSSGSEELQDLLENIIQAFDLESGTFPPNFDPQTGTFHSPD